MRTELPRGIQTGDILDKGAFDTVFDGAKGVFALEMLDALGPKEVKKYQIILRDIWYIPQSELDFLKVETEKLIPLFAKSAYEEFAVKQGDAIFASLQSITLLQKEVESSTVLEDRIRAHVLNEQREKFSKRKIKELQDLLTEISLKPSETDLAAQLRQLVKKLAELKKLVVMAMGFHPKKSILWIIFLGIILFLAVITGIFYSVWLKKLQESTGSELKKKGDKKETEAPKVPESEAKP